MLTQKPWWCKRMLRVTGTECLTCVVVQCDEPSRFKGCGTVFRFHLEQVIKRAVWKGWKKPEPMRTTWWIHSEWPVQIIKTLSWESPNHRVCGLLWTLEWQQATCCLYLWTCGLEFMKRCHDPSADYKFQVTASCKLSEKTVIRSESPWTWFTAGRLLLPGAAVSWPHKMKRNGSRQNAC